MTIVQFTKETPPLFWNLEPHYFDESVDLRNRLTGGRQRDLKADAIPTIVAHKPAFKVRTTSRARAAKQKRQQVRGNVDFQSWNALLIQRDKVCLISGIIITELSPFCEFSNNNIGSSSYVHCSHMLKWKKFTVFLWYLSFVSPFQWAYMNEAWRSSRDRKSVV